MATGLACRLSRYPYPKRLNAAAQSQLLPEGLWCMYALTRFLPVFCSLHNAHVSNQGGKSKCIIKIRNCNAIYSLHIN